MMWSSRHAPSLLALVYTIVSAASAVSIDSCTWKVSVASSKSLGVKEVPFQNDRELLPLDELLHHLKVNYMLPDDQMTYHSYPFFLHLHVICGEELSSEMAHSMVAMGVHPRVTITHKAMHVDNCHDGARTKYTMTGALVAPFTEDDQQQECNHISLCHPFWVSPLIMDKCSVIVEVYVETGSVDRLVQPTRRIIHADGYILERSTQSDTNLAYSNTLGYILDNKDMNASLLLQDRPYKITSVPSSTPSLVIGGIGQSNIVITTTSEFQEFNFVKVVIPTSNIICTDSVTMQYIKQAISFPDRILLSTPAGLYEIFGFYGFLEDASFSSASYGTLTQIFPAHCIREIVLSPHTYTEHVVMLAIGSDEELVLTAEVQSGVPLSFEEVVDRNKKPVCQSVTNMDSTCRIVCAGIGEQNSFQFLVQNKESNGSIVYQIVSLKSYGEDVSEWVIFSQFSASEVPSYEPDHDDPIQLTPYNGETRMQVNLNITGMTFIGLVSHHLFMWGNVLLHSPDGGISVFLLPQYTSSSKIVQLAVSHTNAFAFINDQDELWYGIVDDIVNLHKLRPSAGWTLQFCGISSTSSHWQQTEDERKQYILLVFFDDSDQLFELTARKNISTDKVEVFRRAVPIADIIAYEKYVSAHTRIEHIGTAGNDIPTTESCPYHTIIIEAGIHQFNERIQHFVLSEPHLISQDQLHTYDSIMVYQGIVHQAIKQSSQDIPKVVANKLYDPVARWKDTKSKLKDYYEWLYRIKSVISGIHVPIEEYGKLYERSDHVDTELPSVVYLDLGSSFNFTVYLSLDKPQVHIVPLDSLWLTAVVSDIALLEIIVSRKVNFLTNVVKYEFTVQDKGVLQHQHLPGVALHPASILLHVWNSDFKCIQHSDIGHGELQGSYSMDVLLGCAPGKTLIFDLNATMEYAITEYKEIYDCPLPTPDMPCFYYKQAFYPFFRVLDLATGNADLFTGRYTLRVIGGSQGGLADMRYFSKKEQDKYNLQENAKDETLIWIPVEETTGKTNDSGVIFTHGCNGILWSCQQYSVCSDVHLQFPFAPEYYFLIEVDNRDVDADRTYCDYSVQFIIRVHGFPISPLRSVSIVLWTFGILTVSVLMFALWNQNKHSPIRVCKVKHVRRKVVPIIEIDAATEDQDAQDKTVSNISITSEESDERVLNVYEGSSVLFRKVKQDQESSFRLLQRRGTADSRQFCSRSEEPS